ncbi:stealth conserved region 3 domain-containing protein [Cronobacter universalis]|uniref:Capsular polysaccharide phosphotransferase SacB n=1 Tax=Cronobacter universalis NCTC 9529 TaxID=1074000 RepID=A0AAC8VMT9_9ENTR|nr:stealth family protein [Cronobacter universalis]ALB53703.1 capsule biosynthesis protein CapC [Cronobacter universalis NCTC 9529]ELY3468365.1 stealth conserved region 3 domain-containing protein [Cronobacter universalis]ELY7391354.1 stealth conserved region 3 domain-containing protein [Cronobacter universalis]CCK17371.1 Exopolysaccharide phosphotransferase SCO6023 [Cronobacter universalis NCTC 9529]STC99632.1 Capsular polysaccharide phosphotransferase SacB [Cronobacter universalis NCTC 9529]
MRYRKIKKLLTSPGLFLRDYLLKKHPLILNEINCPQEEESVLIRHDLALEKMNDVAFPVDVVFTWVDNHDSQWRSKFEQYRDSHLQTQPGVEHEPARFDNHNEIFYSVQSVLTFMPWVRRIYIVVDGHQLQWAAGIAKVKVIPHEAIIPERYLPTFNSHVIEAHLDAIPDLAEHFIYFNDDVFAARALPASHFFRGNGLASLFITDKRLAEMAQRGRTTAALSASLNSRALLAQDLGFAPDMPLAHTYVPLRKSLFTEARQRYGKRISAFLPCKFRSNNDLNLPTFLVPWFTYARGHAVPARDICYYFNVRSPAARTHYHALIHRQRQGVAPHSFCANDFSSHNQTVNNYQEQLIAMLETYFENGTHKNV